MFPVSSIQNVILELGPGLPRSSSIDFLMIDTEEGFFKFEQGRAIEKKHVLRNTLTALEIVAEISDIVINSDIRSRRKCFS